MDLAGFMRTTLDEYRYNYTYIPPLALVDKVPRDEQPSPGWYLKIVWLALRIAHNRIARAAGKAGAGGPQFLAFFDDDGAPDAEKLALDHLGLGEVDLGALPLDVASIEQLEAEAAEGAMAGGPLAFSDEAVSARLALLEASKIVARVLAMGIQDPLKILELVVKGSSVRLAGRPGSLEDYRKLFVTLPLPWTADREGEDETFAWMRVAGWNPLVIRRVAALDHGFPVTDAQLRSGTGDPGDGLALAGGEGRLFVTDYAALARVEHGNFPCGPKYSFAPKALFALPRGEGTRRLRPIAIQCGQDPRSYPIFTPADGSAWQKAKLTVSVADFIHHEMISHLGRTHLLIGPFVMATRRRLPDRHPLSVLLRPHFEGTLAINEAAQSGLIARGAVVDKALAGTIEASRALTVATLAEPYFNAGALPDDLAARGVTSPDLDYPYRDDALLVWRAIERWVEAYVELYYPGDDAVAADPDLRAWAAEIAAPDGGRVPGFGERGDGTIATVSYLRKALTMILFTASAQHAALNFPQAGLMTFTPAAPCAAYRAAPLSVADGELSPYLDMLAPLEMANVQVEFLTLLGGVMHTRLGQYPAGWTSDERVARPLRAFQEELATAGAAIEARNKQRLGPYPFLMPDQIPQSINI
jgi:arachidonate 15-lipoxygenase